LGLRAHRAIRRPEAENDAGDGRVEQRNPQSVFLTAQFLVRFRILRVPARFAARLADGFLAALMAL